MNKQDAVSMDQQMLRVLFDGERNCSIGSKQKEDILYGKQLFLYLLYHVIYVLSFYGLTFIFTINEFGWLENLGCLKTLPVRLENIRTTVSINHTEKINI